ncbi:tail protein X [Acinetobacter guillouiae]|uniref:tail protein X n=1 Tax=Acinetobacter guillouiae TaxID=106649 RepID=UPI0028D704A0|nr:tail protein X [Acinetobacter guillouiae]
MKTVYAIQNDTLDAICWRYNLGSAAVVQVLEANSKLSELGPFIPMGTAIQLPDLTTQQNKTTQTIQLWD